MWRCLSWCRSRSRCVSFCALPVSRLIIFEALAVNAGSLLTPIGNPQNILLWGRSAQSFAAFTWQMAPLALVMMLSLLVLTWFSFPARSIEKHDAPGNQQWQKPLFIVSVLLYIVFLFALELKYSLAGRCCWSLRAVFVLLARRVLVSVDWTLLLVFMAMFIDVHFTDPPSGAAAAFCRHRSAGRGRYLWLPAIGLSQFISNVPATILLLNYVPPDTLLAWAVNIGGFGLLPGSLANLIALRMANDRRIWWRFHLCSLPMLAWSMLCGWLLLQLLR